MFGRIQFSKTEQKLLLFATLLIPIFTICIILAVTSIQIYNYIFPPLPKFSPDGWGVDPILAWFRIFTSICLAISAILIVYRKIVFSTLITATPLIAFANWIFTVNSRVQNLLESNSEFGYSSPFDDKSLIENVYSTLDSFDIVFLSFIMALLLWQISIIWRFQIWKSRNGLMLK